MKKQVENAMMGLGLDQIVNEDEENIKLVNDAMKEVVKHPDCQKIVFQCGQQSSEKPAYAFKSPEERELYRTTER